MKCFLIVLLVAVLLLPCFTLPVSALTEEGYVIGSSRTVVGMRAGGGSSGGGSSGGGASGGSSGHHSTGRGTANPISTVVGLILFLIVGSAAGIVFRFRLSRYARNTKRLLRMLQKRDSAWKYKHMQSRVKEAFYAIQSAWTKSDMRSAEQYLSETLLESFRTRLSWMRIRGQQNVLKRIRLIEAIPVSLHDDADDQRDFVWFYLKGRMVDYTVDTETDEILDGSTLPTSFAEYWQFTRNKEHGWVLDQILQEDEADGIHFSES